MKGLSIEKIFVPKKAPEKILKPLRTVAEKLEAMGLEKNARYEWQPKNPRSQKKYDTFVDTREGIYIKPVKDEKGLLRVRFAQIANGNESMTVNLSTGEISETIKRSFFPTASSFLNRMQGVVDKINM